MRPRRSAAIAVYFGASRGLDIYFIGSAATIAYMQINLAVVSCRRAQSRAHSS